MSAPVPHSPFEDAQGLLVGSALCGFGIHILASAGLVTGQTAGLAVLLSYATGVGFGAIFFAINLPFYWLAYRHLGRAFTLKTFAAVALVSGFAELAARLVQVMPAHPAVAARAVRAGRRGRAAGDISPPCQFGRCGHSGLLPARAYGLARRLGAIGLRPCSVRGRRFCLWRPIW